MIKNIAVISIGEIIPEIGDMGRPTRSSILAKFLSNKKYKVKFITNKFNHFTKQNRKDIKKKTKVEYILLSSIGYSKNVSIRRLLDHSIIAIKLFFFLLRTRNDLIICSFPTLGNVIACHLVSKLKNVKLVIDVRDLWPEIFEKYFKKNIFTRSIIKLNYIIRKIVFKHHDIVCISKSYSKTIKKSISYKSEIPIFPLGSIKFNKTKLNNIDEKFKNKITFWFLGSMGKTYDLKNLIKVTNSIKAKNIQFIISGDGDSLDELKRNSKNKNVFFTGWCDLKKIQYYGKIADIGLMPYTSFSTQDLPNKIFDYFSMSLPVLTNISRGDCLKIVNDNKGWFYNSNIKGDLKRQILKISKDKKKIKYFSNNINSFYKKEFSSDVIYKNFTDYILNIN